VKTKMLVSMTLGCGPVGQFAIRSAFLLGAERVIAIDTVPERLQLARAVGAEILDFRKEDFYDRIQDLTSGRGADACIDAVGTEPDTGASLDSVVDRVKVDRNIDPMYCGRPFIAAGTLARFQSSAYMVAFSIRYRWARPLIEG
jgi:threonine dehydrogenase-like Zn-dependent dehydrogenase